MSIPKKKKKKKQENKQTNKRRRTRGTLWKADAIAIDQVHDPLLPIIYSEDFIAL